MPITRKGTLEKRRKRSGTLKKRRKKVRRPPKKKRPKIRKRKPPVVPVFKYIAILEDRQDNPFLELNWKVLKRGGGKKLHNEIAGFAIFRRRLSKSEMARTFAFSRRAFDKFSNKIIRKGKFSDDRKALPYVKSGAIPASTLNPRLYESEQQAKSRQIVPIEGNARKSVFPKPTNAGEEPTQRRAKKRLTNNRFSRIARVAYGKALFFKKKVKSNQASPGKSSSSVSSAGVKKEPTSKPKNPYHHFKFRDKTVGYGEAYEYKIVTIPRRGLRNTTSEIIKVTVVDFTTVWSGIVLKAKQIDENRIGLNLRVRARDKIENFHIYRKREGELSFKRLAIVKNVGDALRVVDKTVKYQNSYIYRVFCKNVFERISRPVSVKVTSTVQRITPYTQSNDMKIPILTTVPDQNSNSIKITISPNDSRVFYYALERRDLTIHERRFSKPGRYPGELPTTTPVYGGDGWDDNRFIVQKDIDVETGATIMKEIVFVDDTVIVDHIYQYRIRGYDLYQNPTSWAVEMVRAVGKKSIRKPINVRSNVVRSFPLRMRLSWEDDNATDEYTQERQFNNEEGASVYYRVQRRKADQQAYQSFPLTTNKFLIDEAVEGRDVDVDRERVARQRVELEGEGIPVRPKGLPPYLSENDIYYYRVAAVMPNGEESNFTSEFEVKTLQPLLPPVNMQLFVNVKIRPLIVEIRWNKRPRSSKPDFWRIDRKVWGKDNKFRTVGRSYLKNVFYDDRVRRGKTYVYRIVGVDTLGRRTGAMFRRITIK